MTHSAYFSSNDPLEGVTLRLATKDDEPAILGLMMLQLLGWLSRGGRVNGATALLHRRRIPPASSS